MVPPNTTLFVDNLTPNISLEKLWKIFHCYGEISHIRIARKRRPHSDRRFAFVFFRRPQDALAAIDSTAGKEIDGQSIRVERAHRRRSNRVWPPPTSHHAQFPEVCQDFLRSNSEATKEKPVHPEESSVHQKSTVRISQSTQMLSKLERSVVFTTGAGSSFNNLSIKHKFEKWVNVEKVINISPEKFLVILGSTEDRQSILGIKPHWNIHAWSMNDQPNKRTATIFIRGIPLCSWSIDNIKTIAEVAGKVIDIKESPYPVACVEIETDQFTTINLEFLAEVKENFFLVGISEFVGIVTQITGSPRVKQDVASQQTPTRDTADSKDAEEPSLKASPEQQTAPSPETVGPKSNSCPADEVSQRELNLLGTNLLLDLLPDSGALIGSFSQSKTMKQTVFAPGTIHEFTNSPPLSPQVSVVADSEDINVAPAIVDVSSSIIRKFPMPSIDDARTTGGEKIGIELESGLKTPQTPASLLELNPAPIAIREVQPQDRVPESMLVNSAHLNPVTPIAPNNHRKGVSPAGAKAFAHSTTDVHANDIRSGSDSLKIQIPNEIPDFMINHYKIGATLLGMEATNEVPLPEAVACLGFRTNFVDSIPNPESTVIKLAETLGPVKRSARIQEKNEKSKPSRTLIDDANSNSSVSITF